MKAEDIYPLDDRYLVEPIPKDEQRTQSGIVIPEDADDGPTLGIVLRIGPPSSPDSQVAKVYVRVGDTIIHGVYAGLSLDVTDYESADLEQKTLLLIHYNDIKAVIIPGGLKSESGQLTSLNNRSNC